MCVLFGGLSTVLSHRLFFLSLLLSHDSSDVIKNNSCHVSSLTGNDYKLKRVRETFIGHDEGELTAAATPPVNVGIGETDQTNSVSAVDVHTICIEGEDHISGQVADSLWYRYRGGTVHLVHVEPVCAV